MKKRSWPHKAHIRAQIPCFARTTNYTSMTMAIKSNTAQNKRIRGSVKPRVGVTRRIRHIRDTFTHIIYQYPGHIEPHSAGGEVPQDIHREIVIQWIYNVRGTFTHRIYRASIIIHVVVRRRCPLHRDLHEMVHVNNTGSRILHVIYTQGWEIDTNTDTAIPRMRSYTDASHWLHSPVHTKHSHTGAPHWLHSPVHTDAAVPPRVRLAPFG